MSFDHWNWSIISKFDDIVVSVVIQVFWIQREIVEFEWFSNMIILFNIHNMGFHPKKQAAIVIWIYT